MRRLTEIQFYFFCRKIIFYTDMSLKTLIELVDLLSFTNYYNCDIIKNTINDMFVKQKGTPTLLECVVLKDKNKALKNEDIRQQFKITQKDIERAFDKACELGIMFKTPNPKFSTEVYENIKGFRKALNKILKWDGYIENG